MSGPSGRTPGKFQSVRHWCNTTAPGLAASRAKDVGKVNEVAGVADRVHDEIPYFGKEHVFEREGNLLQLDRTVGLCFLDVPPTVTKRVGISGR